MKTDMRLTPEMFEFVPMSERDGEEIASQSLSYWSQAWRRFKRDPLAFGGMLAICVIAFAAIVGPMLSPYTYNQQDLTRGNLLPSLSYLCGTDKFGRDILTRILYGARISLSIGIIAAMISAVIGVLYGGISGYAGGKTDMIMMRVVDILISLPSLLYTIIIMMFLGTNMRSVIIAV